MCKVGFNPVTCKNKNLQTDKNLIQAKIGKILSQYLDVWNFLILLKIVYNILIVVEFQRLDLNSHLILKRLQKFHKWQQ